MASYISVDGYDARVRIPSFTGLMQYGDGVNSDPRCAVEAENVITPGGVLQPAGACELLAPSLPSPIATVARLHRRWHAQDGEREVLVAASGGKLYWMLLGGSAWTEMALPTGWAGDGYASDEWSAVTYEMNPDGSDAPVDVLLLSNAEDGMVCVRGDDMTVSAVPTPKKFGVIARYAERIWGGAIADDPDTLVYSAPFNPFDWAANAEIPEDGAGDIQQPSWDGDAFTALTPFGSQLLAFKRRRVWRILGTDPGEYAFKEQYGGGAPYVSTVAVDGERVFMLGDHGVMRYDGLTVDPFYQQYAGEIFERMNANPGTATACVWKNAYYLALPLDGEAANGAVLIYDCVDKTWLLRTGVSVEAFLPTDGALYFTSSTTPGRLWRWGGDAFAEESAATPCRWVSPWFEFSRKDAVKSGYEVYLTPEATGTATLSVSIETDRKTKTKTLTVTAPPSGASAKARRLRFGGSGRRWRLIIESSGTAPWRLLGGAQIDLEFDPD